MKGYPNANDPARREWIVQNRDTRDERPGVPLDDDLFTVDPLPLITGEDYPWSPVETGEDEGSEPGGSQ
jgi:hypothetical protein